MAGSAQRDGNMRFSRHCTHRHYLERDNPWTFKAQDLARSWHFVPGLQDGCFQQARLNDARTKHCVRLSPKAPATLLPSELFLPERKIKKKNKSGKAKLNINFDQKYFAFLVVGTALQTQCQAPLGLMTGRLKHQHQQQVPGESAQPNGLKA